MSLLMLAESLPKAPATLTRHLRRRWNALLPRTLLYTRDFGNMLEPRWIVGTGLLDQ